MELARGLYADEHNPRGALEAAERSVRLDPNNAEAHLLIGQIYGEQGACERALAPLRRAAALFEAQSVGDERLRARLAEARNTLAACLINVQRPDEAIVLLRRVVDEVLYSTPHLAWGNLGLAYIRKGEHQRAVEALERAVALQPNFCVGHYRMGEAYFRLNEHGRALESLDRALRTQVTGCDQIQGAYLLRGRVHVQLHQPDGAGADLRRCVELAPRTPEGIECATLARSVSSGP